MEEAMVSAIEQGNNRVIAENDRTHREAERQARQTQDKQQVSNNQAGTATSTAASSYTSTRAVQG
jgi:hypothetical protein